MRLRQKWNHFWMLELIAAEDRSSSISVKMVYTTDDDDDDDVANQPAEIVVQLLPPPAVYSRGSTSRAVQCHQRSQVSEEQHSGLLMFGWFQYKYTYLTYTYLVCSEKFMATYPMKFVYEKIIN